MIVDYAVRGVKRFVVLVPGIVIAYFSVRTFYPFFHAQLPAALAIFLTYVLAAYVLIPAIFRLYRLLRPAKHLPLYCVTPDGFASDPVNVGIIGTQKQLTKAMKRIGWYKANTVNWRTSIRQIVAVVFRQTYKRAPVSALFLFGRRQDIAFELPLNTRGGRHHVRFWATVYDPDKPIAATNRISAAQPVNPAKAKHLQKDRIFLWLGCASKDAGLSLIRHNAQITHMIDPDTDAERDLIVNGILKFSQHPAQVIRLRDPYRLPNRAWRGYLRADGQLKICDISPPYFPGKPEN
jgi:hypothetical protein